MFPERVPEAPVSHAEPSEGLLVPRPPGWVLIANRHGPQGFHRVKAVGQLASVVTICGVVGRRISEVERMIVLCPICQAE